MKLVTWNVNSVRARLDRVIDWLAQHSPDVLLMQETKVEDSKFPHEAFEAAGYSVAVHGQRTYNGVAIASRTPIQDVLCGFGDGQDDPQARFIAGTVRGVRVMSAYVPNGKALDHPDYQYKLTWLRRLSAHLRAAAAPEQSLVLGGDFNVAADDRDVHDPLAWRDGTHVSDPERAALRELVAWGLTDAFREQVQEGGIFSWWDYRMLAFPKNRGLRIDYLFVTELVRARLQTVAIDRDARKGKKPSDHAPVWLSLRDD